MTIPTEPGIPVLVRLAGLPAATMAPFRSPSCAECLAALDHHDDALAGARSAMVDRLFDAIHGAEPERRHFLLGVKRDCYNGRPLERHRDDPQWPLLEEIGGPLAAEILALETTRDTAYRALEQTYGEERDRERRALPELLDNPGLLRGLALASPVLVANVDRLRGADPGSYDRKTRKQAESLLRYASRAALKLSPYSTLTRVALGVATEDEPTAEIHLAPGPWDERSLMRLKRYSLNQHIEMLLRYDPFRVDLPLELNKTVEESAPGQYRFLRMGSWQADPKTRRLSFQRDALVSVALGGSLVGWLLDNLRNRDPLPTYRQVIETLAAELSGAEGPNDTSRAQVAQALEQLIQVGFLRFRLPWPTNELHLERRLLDHLRGLGLGPDPGLQPIVDELATLVEHELGYASTDRPLASVQILDRQLHRLSESMAALGTYGPGVRCQIIPKGNFFEDVFVTPRRATEEAGPGTPPPFLRLPRATADELLATTRPLVRLSDLFDSRLELGLTIAGFLRRQGPGRREIGLLELFGAFQPLWKRFLEHSVSRQRAAGEPFDPLGLESIAELAALRQRLGDELARRVEASEGEAGETRLDPAELAAVAAQIPDDLTLPIGAALLLQPADATGERWVVNQWLKGTGRSGSRFTAGMDPRTRRGYAEHLVERSALRHRGRRFELLDLMCVQGDTLNVHVPQTRWALELPGLPSDLPPERRRSPTDLRLALEAEDLLPTLVDGTGRAFLPVHLGVSGLVFMPTLIRFLSVLGVGEHRTVGPRPRRHQVDGVVIDDRLVVGRAVLQRRRWTFGRKALPRKLGSLGEAEAFAAIHRWRMAHGLPDRIFFKELRLANTARRVFKPQAVDFTSPAFVTILRGTLESRPEQLVIEEMLPEPEAFPTDAGGRRWAVELLLDALAFAEPETLDDDGERAREMADR